MKPMFKYILVYILVVEREIGAELKNSVIFRIGIDTMNYIMRYTYAIILVILSYSSAAAVDMCGRK